MLLSILFDFLNRIVEFFKNLIIIRHMNKNKQKNETLIIEPHFSIGNVVTHTKYNFRAVVIDVDGSYEGLESTLIEMSDKDRPDANQPWYHLLVHGGEDFTYVAECMLYSDSSSDPITHPMIDKFLVPNLDEGHYQPNTLMN